MSEARDFVAKFPEVEPFLGIPAPCSMSGNGYRVGYFRDNSILVHADNHGYLILDECRTYYREDVEHLARCLAIPKERRAEMAVKYAAGGDKAIVSNLVWSLKGDFLGFA